MDIGVSYNRGTGGGYVEWDLHERLRRVNAQIDKYGGPNARYILGRGSGPERVARRDKILAEIAALTPTPDPLPDIDGPQLHDIPRADTGGTETYAAARERMAAEKTPEPEKEPSKISPIYIMVGIFLLVLALLFSRR